MDVIAFTSLYGIAILSVVTVAMVLYSAGPR